MANALNINASDQNNQLPALPSVFGPVVLDQPFKRYGQTDNQNWVPIYIRIGRGAPDVVGDLVIEDQDGVVGVIPSCVMGEYVPITKVKRVLTSATIEGVTYTTTCENMTWFGGSK